MPALHAHARPRLIAEIGLNHLGDPERAARMVRALAATAVDAITLQVREPAFYDGTKPWRRALPADGYAALANLATAGAKEFGLAIADLAAVPALDSFVSFWKTLSWDLSNEPLQRALQATKKRVHVSTGTGSTEDVRIAVAPLARVELIHTQLTHELSDVNLRAIETLRNATGLEVGFGLHAKDPHVLLVALGCSPASIFFYVKEPFEGKQPDDEHAIPLAEVAAWAERLSKLSAALGDGVKTRMEKKL